QFAALFAGPGQFDTLGTLAAEAKHCRPAGVGGESYMTKRKLLLLAVVLGMMAATAGLLGYLRVHQKLGEPRVKGVEETIVDEKGDRVANRSVYLPEQVLDYSSAPAALTRLELDWLPKDTTFGRRLYKAADGFEMLVGVVLMGADRTSIHKPQ